MATFGCKCGFVMHLSQGGNDHDFNIIRKSIIEEAGKAIASRKISDLEFFDLVDTGKSNVLLCTKCERLHIQISDKNKFTSYTSYMQEIDFRMNCACAHGDHESHDFEIIWDAKISEVGDKLYHGGHLSEKDFYGIIGAKRLLAHSCQKCGRLWVKKAGEEIFVPYIKEFQQSETPAVFISGK